LLITLRLPASSRRAARIIGDARISRIIPDQPYGLGVELSPPTERGDVRDNHAQLAGARAAPAVREPAA